LPWAGRLAILEVWPLLNVPAAAAAVSGYNDFPWAYFRSSLERGWLVAAALAALWGLLNHERVVWALAGWIAVTFALLNIGPGSWIVNNNSWAISIFVPGTMLAGWGADQWLTAAGVLRESERRWVERLMGGLMGVLLAGVAAYAGLLGARAQVGIVNSTTVLASADDKTALKWLDQNTPPEAVFLVNSWIWQNNIWSASDGGIWLWPLIGRKTTAPPVDYIYQPDWKAEVNTFNSRAASMTDWTTPEARVLLREAGVTHVFIGERGGFLKPELFIDKTGYRLIYSNGADWVFELK
jgi:hypothetical protein